MELITKKNNALTDGSIPDRKVLTQKLLNVLNKEYESNGTNFKVAVNDLATKLNMTVNSGKTKQMIYQSLSILQQPIQLRNFDYKGRGIKWISAPFLSEATIFNDDKNYVTIQLNDKIIEGLKQKNGYTVIDLNISNQFKTKYGIVIWEMYLRYKNQKRDDEQWTYQSFTLDDLNRKFGTKYKYNSDILKCINRGLKEIKKITGKDIIVHYIKQEKKFYFWWEREVKLSNHLKDLRTFIRYIRKNKVNEDLYQDEKLCLSVSPKGRLYNKYTAQEFNKDDAIVIWQKLYERELRKQQEDSVELS